MLKYRTKIKKENARLLSEGYMVEHKVYVPRGQANIMTHRGILTRVNNQTFLIWSTAFLKLREAVCVCLVTGIIL